MKIFCRDEKGERVDVSKYLIKKGLALRERRYWLFFLTSVYNEGILFACVNSYICVLSNLNFISFARNDLQTNFEKPAQKQIHSGLLISLFSLISSCIFKSLLTFLLLSFPFCFGIYTLNQRKRELHNGYLSEPFAIICLDRCLSFMLEIVVGIHQNAFMWNTDG